MLSLAVLVGSGVLFHLIASWLITSGFSLIVNGIFRKAYLALSNSKLELEVSRRSLQKPGIRQVVTFVIVLVVCMLISARESYQVLKETTLSRPVEVVAHRGASAIAPENTIAAIQAAIESGADWVEIDVQMTSDGEIVVIHDSDLKKIGGSGLVVGTSTFEALRQVDIGSWFSPEFSDQRIPTLLEVLELCDGKIGVIVEIKRYGVNEQLVPVVLGIVEAFKDRNRIAIMSLDHETIRQVQAIDSSLKTGLLSSVAVGQLPRLDIDFLAINARGANRRLIREVRLSGKNVVVWTVNDALGISAMISRGVDAIITDNPALVVEILDKRTSYGPLGHLLNQFADLFDRPALFHNQ